MRRSLKKIAIEQDRVIIKDNRRDRIAELMIRNRELQCLLDEKKTDGIHIGFVYTPPEVYAMLKKKEGIIKSRSQ